MAQKYCYFLLCSTQNARIKSIINLQTPGEHASCGPNLQQANGFTYDPNEFMSQDIFYYNFAWKDYGEASSMSGLLDMVKVRTGYLISIIRFCMISNTWMCGCISNVLTVLLGSVICFNGRKSCSTLPCRLRSDWGTSLSLPCVLSASSI